MIFSRELKWQHGLYFCLQLPFHSLAVRLVGGLGRKQLSRCVHRSWAVLCGPFLQITLGVTIGDHPESLALPYYLSSVEGTFLPFTSKDPTLVFPEVTKGRCIKHNLHPVCRCRKLWGTSQCQILFWGHVASETPMINSVEESQKRSWLVTLLCMCSPGSQMANGVCLLLVMSRPWHLTDYDPRLFSPLSKLTMSSNSGSDTARWIRTGLWNTKKI